ncbi:MAG TPA: hypothetical protein VD971_12640 [Phycisphaerales bacterium]|nr:hypothetical protein [Phycisphaerales bacterium]
MPTRPRPWLHALIVAALGAALCFPLLDYSGLSHAEGQRVQPAREMAATGDWLVVRLFGQAYMRKPPGMVWAIAAASRVLGESDAAARAVSGLGVIAGGLVTLLFARRWFGPACGLFGGIAFVLFPAWYWYPPVARSAEIEALHNLWCLLAACLMIDLSHGGPLRLRARVVGDPAWSVLRSVALCAAVAAMFLTKGPAGVALIAGAFAAGLFTGRPRWRSLLAAVLVGTGAVAWWAISAHRAIGAAPVVVESPEKFLFEHGKIVGILTLPFAAFVAALPWSISLVRSPAPAGAVAQITPARIGRALALTVAGAVILSMLLGVSNPRYLLPVFALLPACAAAAAWNDALEPPILARRTMVWTIVLLVINAALAGYAEHRRATRTSGEADGERLGLLLQGPAELWGDELLDQRPEIAMAAARTAAARGHRITVRWTPRAAKRAAPLSLPPPGGYVLVRTDTRHGPREEPEAPDWFGLGLRERADLAFTGAAHNFRYEVWRIKTGS